MKCEHIVGAVVHANAVSPKLALDDDSTPVYNNNTVQTLRRLLQVVTRGTLHLFVFYFDSYTELRHKLTFYTRVKMLLCAAAEYNNLQMMSDCLVR